MTRWAAEVTPETVHPEYPRPQLVRDEWLNLNGLWDLAIVPNTSGRPERFDREVLVPFPVESALSGVMERVDGKRLWYRRTFTVPDGWDERVLLHFGAVDWDATVWVNGMQVGRHLGGYDPFSFDITDALMDAGEQEVMLSVLDPSDAGTQPRGKQVREPEGIWYTPSSGIWQTVWLEPVPETYLKRLKLVPDIDAGVLNVSARVQGGERRRLEVTVKDGSKPVARLTGPAGEVLRLPVPDAKLWSPDDPFLYGLEVRLLEDGEVVDQVTSYAGMRKIALGKDQGGVTRIFLNNEPLFGFGLLDQGFWPDGLYTAPTDAALRYDLETTIKMGFNTVRKHVKVEPARWYYHADRLGLLVWQDMPSGDVFVDNGSGEITRTPESARQFELELQRMIDNHANSPAIVMWVLFNEGWGQYDTVRLTEWLEGYDPSRLLNSVSGWNDMGVGDTQDLHCYPNSAETPLNPDQAAVSEKFGHCYPSAEEPPLDSERATIFGEFGGLGLPIQGLTWQDEANWGYQEYSDQAALLTAYSDLLTEVRDLSVSQRLTAAIYTQTTDVETEVNGLMTYDRRLVKLETPRLNYLASDLYGPFPVTRALSPTSETAGVRWRYTTEPPAAGWHDPGFDDSAWPRNPGGFGEAGMPGGTVRTPWETRELWLRRTFTFSDPGSEPYLRIHHDEDAAVYLNGVLVADLPYYTTGYVDIPLDDEARAALRPGRNTLGVYCKRVAFGGFCDAGLYDLVEPE